MDAYKSHVRPKPLPTPALRKGPPHHWVCGACSFAASGPIRWIQPPLSRWGRANAEGRTANPLMDKRNGSFGKLPHPIREC